MIGGIKNDITHDFHCRNHMDALEVFRNYYYKH